VTSKLDNIKEAFDSLSDVDKEALRFGGRIFAQSILFSLTKTTIVHVLGRRIAPKVFKSWGRTFALLSLLETATGRYKLSDEDKKTVARIKEAQADQKLEEIRGFGV